MQEERRGRGRGGGKVGKGGGGRRGRGGGGGEIQRASALHDPAKLNNFDARRQQENLGNSGTRSEWEYSPPVCEFEMQADAVSHDTAAQNTPRTAATLLLLLLRLHSRPSFIRANKSAADSTVG